MGEVEIILRQLFCPHSILGNKVIRIMYLVSFLNYQFRLVTPRGQWEGIEVSSLVPLQDKKH